MMIEWLQEHGVSIDEVDVTGRTPLDYAKKNRNHDVIAYLEEMYEIVDI
jgi:ankyrin repeat protein